MGIPANLHTHHLKNPKIIPLPSEKKKKHSHSHSHSLYHHRQWEYPLIIILIPPAKKHSHPTSSTPPSHSSPQLPIQDFHLPAKVVHLFLNPQRRTTILPSSINYGERKAQLLILIILILPCSRINRWSTVTSNQQQHLLPVLLVEKTIGLRLFISPSPSQRPNPTNSSHHISYIIIFSHLFPLHAPPNISAKTKKTIGIPVRFSLSVSS